MAEKSGPHPVRQPLEGKRDEEAVARFEGHLAAMRRAAVGAAQALAEIEVGGHWILEGCSSIAQFGERHGASAREARELVALARALPAYSDLAGDLDAGRVSLQSAATLGRLAQRAERVEGVPFEPTEWAKRAREEPARDLTRHVDEWLESQRIGARPITVTAHLSAKGMEDFEKSREIASQKARRVLSVGETVEQLASYYREAFDLTCKTPKERRLPDTETIPTERYVAAQVRRTLALRQRGCAVPRCPNRIFVEMSHRVAHAAGGSREARNLDHLCSYHHAMYEQGLLRIEGPTDAPRFYDVRGREITSESAWAHVGKPGPRPPSEDRSESTPPPKSGDAPPT
jgi:hypothetical protein